MIKPFDLTSNMTELLGGYRSEYSGLWLNLFILGDMLSKLVLASLLTIMFLGGWLSPDIIVLDKIPPVAWFIIKILLCFLLIVFIEKVMPRLREDQMRAILWEVIFPINILWCFLTATWLFINN